MGVPQDSSNDVRMQAIICMMLAAMCNALWYVCIGRGLKYVDLATLFFMHRPMSLGLNCLGNIFIFGESIDGLAVAGIVIIVVGFAVDRCYELRQKGLNDALKQHG